MRPNPPSGSLTCEDNFCATCALKGKCDMTCGLPCPTEGVQFPPGQPFLLCFPATCDAPVLDKQQVRVPSFVWLIDCACHQRPCPAHSKPLSFVLSLC
jgi:hypothetical protein